MSSNSTQLNRFMAALSAAEYVTAATPVAPHSVDIAPESDWGFVPGTFDTRIGVQMHFGSVSEVRLFAQALEVAVASRPHGEKTFTFADGDVNGVPFRAWTLGAANASAVAA